MAMDMSKVKGQSSTEYGESLLAETRASNARIRKQNQKNSDKYARMSLGVNAAIGFAENVMEKKQQEFFALEENAKNILQTKNAYTNASTVTEEEKLAQANKTGYSSYFNSIAENNVREALFDLNSLLSFVAASYLNL